MRILITLLFVIIILSGCEKQNTYHAITDTSSSWAYELVVFQNQVFTGSAEKIAPDMIQEQIGKIENFSTTEMDHLPNNFSNHYIKGTKLFKIKDIDISDSIAIQVSDTEYFKATVFHEK
jgi:hypothetical protein